MGTERPLVAVEGRNIGTLSGIGLETCKSNCDATPACKSFSLETGAGDCHLKDKEVSESDPDSTEEHGKDGSFVTFFKQEAISYKERSLVKFEGNSVGDFHGLGYT